MRHATVSCRTTRAKQRAAVTRRVPCGVQRAAWPVPGRSATWRVARYSARWRVARVRQVVDAARGTEAVAADLQEIALAAVERCKGTPRPGGGLVPCWPAP